MEYHEYCTCTRHGQVHSTSTLLLYKYPCFRGWLGLWNIFFFFSLITFGSLIKTGSSTICCSHCRLNLLKNKKQKKTTSYTLNKGCFLKHPYLLVLIWSQFRKLLWKLVIGIRLRLTNSSLKQMLFCSFQIWLIDTR